MRATGKIISVVLVANTVNSDNGGNNATNIGTSFIIQTSGLTLVPEPGIYALFASLGLTGAAFLRRRRTR